MKIVVQSDRNSQHKKNLAGWACTKTGRERLCYEFLCAFRGISSSCAGLFILLNSDHGPVGYKSRALALKPRLQSNAYMYHLKFKNILLFGLGYLNVGAWSMSSLLISPPFLSTNWRNLRPCQFLNRLLFNNFKTGQIFLYLLVRFSLQKYYKISTLKLNGSVAYALLYEFGNGLVFHHHYFCFANAGIHSRHCST